MTTLHANLNATTATAGMRPPATTTKAPTFNAAQRTLIGDFANKYGITDGKGFTQSLALLKRSESPSNAPSFLHGPRHGGEGTAMRQVGRHVEQALHRMFHSGDGPSRGGAGHGPSKGHGHLPRHPHAHHPADKPTGHAGGKQHRPATGKPAQAGSAPATTQPVPAEPSAAPPVAAQPLTPPIKTGPIAPPVPSTQPSGLDPHAGLPTKALDMLKDLGTLMKSLGLLDKQVQAGLTELRTALEKAAGSAAMPDSVQGVQAA